MKERHWASLITSLRHGQCVLVLGPEVPVVVKGSTRTVVVPELLTSEITSELAEDGRLVNGNTLASVAQQYEDAHGFGPIAMRALAERFYKTAIYEASDVHRLIAELPIGLVLTTCQDNLFARALKIVQKTPVVQRYHYRGDKHDNPEFLIPASPQTPIIYHLFGDIHEPRSLVLSENDLLDFLIAIVSERPSLPNSLVRVLKRTGQSFLFLGFGIKQWYLRVLLKVILRTLELDRTSSAIAAESLQEMPKLEREQTILFYQRGTRVELEDDNLAGFVGELHRRLAIEGGFSATTTHAVGPCPRVFISYASEDNDLAARVFHALQDAHFEPWIDKEYLVSGTNWDEHIQDELSATDFTLVLYTKNLCRKTDSYVNKEIALARERALSVRGSFIIPLRTMEIDWKDRVSELSQYQEALLRPDQFDDDLAKVMSTMRRDYQRRNR